MRFHHHLHLVLRQALRRIALLAGVASICLMVWCQNSGSHPHPYGALWLLGGYWFNDPRPYYRRLILGYLIGGLGAYPLWLAISG